MTNTSEINETAQQDPASGSAGGISGGCAAGVGIGAIAHEIGLTKDTLRVWERRYGFPQPLRSAGGERLYPQEQVTKLRLVKRLLDAGHRPSKVLGQSIDALQALAETSGVGQDAPDAQLDHLVNLLREGAYDDFRFELLKRATREGLERFVLNVAAPLSARVGNAWAAGTLQVYHEHLFSEAMQVTLRSMLRPLSDTLRGRHATPRILLTTLPGEMHGLGMLMAEAMFALVDCECIALGTQTPMQDIAAAVSVHKVDIVALSFSASVPAQAVLSGLAELRGMLPPKVTMWAGGSSPALRRTLQDGVEQVPGLAHVEEVVTAWRNGGML
jgi:MerR family transcriptional regulator, light-induced transcriptional regulator